MTKNKVSNAYATLVFGVLFMTWLLCGSASASAVHVVSPGAGIDITTEKVVEVTGVIMDFSYIKFLAEMQITQWFKGPRVIIIDSPGGFVDSGGHMVEVMRAEQLKGVKMICVVKHEASSMAFNLLSFCDVRLAAPDSYGVVHKVATGLDCSTTRCTSEFLYRLAKQMDRIDDVYRRNNACKMNLSLEDYDFFASNETSWSAMDLLNKGYLQGLATISWHNARTN